MVTDEDLLERCLSGDTRAFGALVERHESAVCAVSFAVTGDREISEDVAQDAFLAAWKSLPALREPERFKSWACGIARNLARKARGLRGRVAAVEAEPVDSSPNAEELIDTTNREAAVWAALEQLSPTYREPLVLYYREGRSTKEVASALGLSISTVEQRLSRGRKHLRAEVTDMVERTLEERPTRGRISAAVVGTIEAGGIPVGESVPGSHAPSPAKTTSSAMKTVLIASAAIATLGLGAVAISSTQDDSASSSATAASSSKQAVTDAARAADMPPSEVAAARPQFAHAQPKSEVEHDNATASSDLAPAFRGAFEITPLGDGRVAMDVRGGKSKMTSMSTGGDPPSAVGHIEGKVVDAQGRPVEGAVVLGGSHLTMTFGTALSSSAGVVTDARGSFVLPAYSAERLVVLAAHHEHGMSRLAYNSTSDAETSLRLEPFAYVEGTVREGDGGIPARVILLGSKKPRVMFGGSTEDDGTYRLGPLPPGTYTGVASTAMNDPGNVTKFAETPAKLTSDAQLKLDFTALEGTLLTIEQGVPEGSDLKTVRYGVFSGAREIATVEAFDRAIKDGPRDEVSYLLRGGIDANSEPVNFNALEPGTYTACACVTARDDVDTLSCEQVEVAANDVTVVEFPPAD